jgi:hypothetical protein
MKTLIGGSVLAIMYNLMMVHYFPLMLKVAAKKPITVVLNSVLIVGLIIF